MPAEEDRDKKEEKVKIKVVEEQPDKEKEEEASNEKVQKKEPEKSSHESKPEDESANEKPEKKTPVKEKPKPKPDKLPFWILFFAFLLGLTLGAGLIGGIFYYRSRVDNAFKNEVVEEATVSETDLEASSPAPAETSTEAEIDLSEYTVQILNGSGIAGEAGRVEALLNNAEITDTTKGNAGSYDFTKTEVALKKDVPSAVYDEIADALPSYVVTEADPLGEIADYDIIITVGSEKAD